MRHVLAIAAAVGLVISTTAASVAAKKHPRYVRHAVAPATVAPAPSWSFGARPAGCVQDEGYGRWTYCGQGPP
jgi:hypothetical protein